VSINAIRGLILLANVVLMGLIGWAGYQTFWAVDREKWEVEQPAYEKYTPPQLADDEAKRDQQRYKVISKAFDPEKPKVAPPTAPTAAPTADVRQIQVLQIHYNPKEPAASSALLSGPLSRDPATGQPAARFFMAGQELGQPGLCFEAYKNAKVKEITEKDVLFIDQQGKEVRIPGPPLPKGSS
jgi:hypothetical protein